MKISFGVSAASFEEAVKAFWKVKVCKEEPDVQEHVKLHYFFFVHFFGCYLTEK